MDFEQLQKIHDYRTHFSDFQSLMPYRIRNILIVSSEYDYFILEEGGHLDEMILQNYLDLHLDYAPHMTRVSSGSEALRAIQEQGFSLIVTTRRLGDMNVLEFARKVKEIKDIPLVLIAYGIHDVESPTVFESEHIDRVFVWQGDFRILLTIIKYIEDRKNVENDTRLLGVPSIILVEDDVFSYSVFLPLIYKEVMNHTRTLITEGVSTFHKLLRVRARPKILLCSTFDEAWTLYEKYQRSLLGIISDLEFPLDGQKCSHAGIELAQKIKAIHPDMPIVLQSHKVPEQHLLKQLDVPFILKRSPTHLARLRKFMLELFGFGDFVFRLPDGTEIGRAVDLASLEKQLTVVPAESIRYHGERNHFSRWLKVRTEFLLADRLKPRRVEEYKDLEDVRQYILDELRKFKRERSRGYIEDFAPDVFASRSFARIGAGSIGGKARGLAFVNNLLESYNVSDLFPGIEISVPATVCLSTEIFDQFLDENDLRDFALSTKDDQKIRAHFIKALFPENIRTQLASFLQFVDYPLAIRSSSLLEDSQYQPFAGIYETYMVPNCHDNFETRMEQLVAAIKLVYASTFSHLAKTYIQSTPYRLEEEKMAVIIQGVTGSRHENRFYPDLSGVARSHNFYPKGSMSSEDGIVSIALGLGKTVVEGRRCRHFCPKYPRREIQFLTLEDTLKYSQRDFFALDLANAKDFLESRKIRSFGLDIAEKDGTIRAAGSTYSVDDHAIYNGTSRSGARVVTFAPILKHKSFPLAEITRLLLDMGQWGMACPVEIEFAVNLSTPPGAIKQFNVLQMRPMVLKSELEEIDVDCYDKTQLLCQSYSALGNAVIDNIGDIVVVDIHRFKRSQSKKTAMEIASLNNKLASKSIPYLLIVVGRLGSQDPWLGIPVTWGDISGVSVIVETNFQDFIVTPSEGSHFFQNLLAFDIGYFTVNKEHRENFLDWDWLLQQKPLEQKEFVRHLRLAEPLVVKIDGRKTKGIILRP